jgi:hypothetical protein
MRHRAAALACAAGLLALSAAAPQATEAAWTDPAFGRGSFAASAAPGTPSVVDCVIVNSPGILNRIDVRFTLPASTAGVATPTTALQYGSGATQSSVAAGGTAPTLSGPVSGVYTASYSAGVLSGLLGSVIGGTVFLGIRSSGNGWVSAWTIVRAEVTLLNLNSTCTKVA